MPAIRLSYAAAVILQALAEGYRYGFDVMDFVGLPSGTVYPALRRLEAAGLVKSQWEKPEVSQREARPARKYYDLTRSGREALRRGGRSLIASPGAETATGPPGSRAPCAGAAGAASRGRLVAAGCSFRAPCAPGNGAEESGR